MSGSNSQRGSAYPTPVERLIAELAQLPGIGRRSAERLAFHLLRAPAQTASDLAKAITDVKSAVRHCSACANLTEADPCPICADPARDRQTILVVEQPKDLIALEQTGMYKGVYHVLLGRISPLEGVGAGDLTVGELIARVKDPSKNTGGVKVTEVVLGLNPTIEGDATAMHLSELLDPLANADDALSVTRLARGLPTGGQMEFVSKAVLADAIQGRRRVD